MKNFTKNLSTERLLAISIGICYFWFGVLKFFPGLSPADSLAKETINSLTFGLIPSDVSIILLAIWEVGIGICLILNIQIRRVIILTLVHMVCTFTPLIFFPELSFNYAPFTLTLVGQYIMKNLIIIVALLILYPKDTNVQVSGTAT
jgi:uncharacterized membrane protein YkgB